MNLIDKFSQLINRLRPGRGKTTSDEMRRPKRAGVLSRFRLDHDRQSMIRDCRQMYDEDPRAEGFINTLARDAVEGGFQVMVNEGSEVDKAQTIANETINRLNLYTHLDDWSRLAFRDGDTLLELSVNSEAIIEQVTRKPTLNIHRHSNRVDRFEDPRRAYWIGDDLWSRSVPGDDAIWFADWQIIHARWRHDEGSRYGRPLFASARTNYKYMTDGERDVWVRRRTRSGTRYNHKVEGDETAVEAYIEQNKTTLDDPLAAIQDFFGNVDIKVVQGDGRLSEIGDVEHHIETWAMASPVPLTLIGYGKALNRDILEQKLDQYDRALGQVTRWVEAQLLKPLLEMQWLLLGVWPKGIDYSVKWASKKKITAETLKVVAEAGVKLRGMGWPDEIIVEILAPFIPGLDPKVVLAAIEKMEAGRPDEIERIAVAARG